MTTTVALGASAFGRQLQLSDAAAVLDQAIHLGVDVVDTAPVYGSGFLTGDCSAASSSSETLVGRLLRSRPGIKVQTKTGVRHHVFGTRLDKLTPGTAPYIRASLEQSLQRLGVDHVETLYHHWPTPSVPIAETLGGLADVVQMGLTRSFGLSNYPECQLKHLHANGLQNCAIQLESNLVNPHGPIVGFRSSAYFVLFHGILTDRFHRQGVTPRSRLEQFPAALTERSISVSNSLRLLALREGVSATALAVRAVVEFGRHNVILGATRSSQLPPQILGVTMSLSDECLEGLENLWRRGRSPST